MEGKTARGASSPAKPACVELPKLVSGGLRHGLGATEGGGTSTRPHLHHAGAIVAHEGADLAFLSHFNMYIRPARQPSRTGSVDSATKTGSKVAGPKRGAAEQVSATRRALGGMSRQCISDERIGMGRSGLARAPAPSADPRPLPRCSGAFGDRARTCEEVKMQRPTVGQLFWRELR